MTRVVAWNIRAGGGKRIEQIAAQIKDWGADVTVLSEFRATPASVWLQEALANLGLIHQVTTADPAQAATNSLLIASRWTLEPIVSRGSPKPNHRWLLVAVGGSRPFAVGAMHIPTFSFAGKHKYAFHNAVLRIAKSWGLGPALMGGDTNTGRTGIDEESPVFNKQSDAWMVAMEAAGWADSFRRLHGYKREYTWYSPNAGNGFRLDEVFINTELMARLAAVRHEWALTPDSKRRDAVSDHAAVIVDLAD